MQFRLAGYPAIFSSPVPSPCLAKMIPGTGVPDISAFLALSSPSEYTEESLLYRALVLPDNAERLMFLKYNTSLIKSQ